MNYADLEDAIVAKLAPIVTAGHEVEYMPSIPSDNKAIQHKGRITVATNRSRGNVDDIHSLTNTTVQDEMVYVDVFIRAKRLRTNGVNAGCYELAELAKRLLIGWRPPNCYIPLKFVSLDPVDPNGIEDSVFTYALTLVTSTVATGIEEDDLSVLISQITVSGSAQVSALLPTVQLYASSYNVLNSGEQVVIAWASENADTVTINNGIGNVSVLGNMVFTITSDVTFTISAVNGSEVDTASIEITVGSNCADATATINSQSLGALGQIESGGLQNFRVVQDAVEVGALVGNDWVVPPCTSASLDVAYSNTTPTFGDTITLTITPTGITPTSHSLTVVGAIDTKTITQVGNVFTWVVDTLTPTFYIQAKEGANFAATVDNGVSPVSTTEADAFISDVETAISGTLGNRQKDACNVLAWMFEGNGTTNSSNLWSLFNGTESTMYIHCPTNDTTLDFRACEIDFLRPSHVGSYDNMVASDIDVYGVKGGTNSKRLNMKVQPADFGQDNVMYHCYRTTYGFEYLTVYMGVHVSNQNTTGVSYYGQFNRNQSLARVNIGGGDTVCNKESITGILSFGRDTNNQMKGSTNGNLNEEVAGQVSTTPLSEDIYGHGYHNSLDDSVGNPTSLRFAGFAVTPYLTADQYKDFCEAWDKFNQIIIPNGRKAQVL